MKTLQKNKSQYSTLVKYALLMLIIVFLTTTRRAVAQKLRVDAAPQHGKQDENKIFSKVDREPEFPGGNESFMKFLSKNIHYPDIDKKNNIQGKVYINFIVERDGSLTDIKALRGPSKTTEEEAIRALKASPKWKPGVQDKRPVRVVYTIPVSFTLNKI